MESKNKHLSWAVFAGLCVVGVLVYLALSNRNSDSGGQLDRIEQRIEREAKERKRQQDNAEFRRQQEESSRRFQEDQRRYYGAKVLGR